MILGLWLLLVAQPAPRLLGAEVTVGLDRAGATVDAVYRLSAADGEVVLHALRVPDQTLTELSGSSPPRLARLPGLYRIQLPRRAAGRDGEAEEVRLRYRVEGPGRRIPLFVPAGPAEPGSVLEIRVHGVDPSLPLDGGFPRMERTGEGELVARPDNLPTFVLLPSGRALTLNRVADAAVLLVILLASGAWLRWRWRVARARASSGVRAGEGDDRDGAPSHRGGPA